MNKNIYIEKPCSENFHNMTSVTGGKFCSTCETKVVDFTKMSLEEIQNFFANHSSNKICGRYNAHHIVKNKWTEFLNKIENTFFKTRFRRLALWCVTLLFFVTNNYRCIMGKRVEPIKSKEDSKPRQNLSKEKQ
jgi:hypothetical protein